MLAEHIEAAVLQHLHVVFHPLLGRRGKKPVGPPSLVEGADHEVGLVVEEEPENALRVLALLDLAHAEVALHHVLAVLRREVVELRALRRPKGNWRGQLDRHWLTGDELTFNAEARRRRGRRVLDFNRPVRPDCPGCPVNLEQQRHFPLVDVGDHLI